MRKTPHFFTALAGSFLLSACSTESEVNDNSALEGGDTFLELVNDARLATGNGNLTEAGELYDEARELEPENPGLWVDIARLRFRGGEHLTAIEAADYAIELDPNYAPALLMRAQLVRDASGMEESLPWFEAAMQADPRNPEVVADYAATLGDLGRYSDMLTVVRELSSFAPNYPQVHYLQAVLAARGGDPVLASNLLSRSGQSERGVPSAMMLAAILEMQSGNFDSAAEMLEMLSERQPANMRVDELLARALWLGGRDRELIDRFARKAARADASPYLIMLVGRSLERRGQRDRGIPLIQRALESQADKQISLAGSSQGSNMIPAVTAELRDFVEAGRVNAAQRAARTLLSRAPYSGDFHALAGDTELAAGREQDALEYYGTAASVRRSWPLTCKIIAAYCILGVRGP